MHLFPSRIEQKLAHRYLYGVDTLASDDNSQRQTVAGKSNFFDSWYFLTLLLLIIAAATVFTYKAPHHGVSLVLFSIAIAGMIFLIAQKMIQKKLQEDMMASPKIISIGVFTLAGIITVSLPFFYRFSSYLPFLYAKVALSFAAGFVVAQFFQNSEHPKQYRIAMILPWLFLFLSTAHLYFFVGPPTGAHAVLLFAVALIFIAVVLKRIFSTASAVSTVGLVLGTAILLTVMSVTSGFLAEIKKRTTNVTSDIIVRQKYGGSWAQKDVKRVSRQLAQNKNVKAVSVVFLRNVMLSTENVQSSGSWVGMFGIDTHQKIRATNLEELLVADEHGKKPVLSNLLPAENKETALPGLFLGEKLAQKLKVKIGDTIKAVTTPAPSADDEPGDENSTALKMVSYQFAGVLKAGFEEYDRRLAIADSSTMNEFKPYSTWVQVKLMDKAEADKVAAELQAMLGKDYDVADWMRQQQNIASALQLQKIVLGIILYLIIIVAGFNIIAVLAMLIINKTAEIAILKTIGLSDVGIRAVFRYMGLHLGLWGAACGILLGLLMCAIIKKLGYLLDSKVYLITQLPVAIRPMEIVIVALAGVIVAMFATIYPTRRAAALRPVDGLRYE